MRSLTSYRALDIFRSYYGGLICVCWSPDGKYIVTGGQDDLVTIWSFPERRIIARCQGHNSWVSAVAFDPWRCDQKTYRFGSVGDDCRLLLWDFSVGMLHRPRAVRTLHIFFMLNSADGLRSIKLQRGNVLVLWCQARNPQLVTAPIAVGTGSDRIPRSRRSSTEISTP